MEILGWLCTLLILIGYLLNSSQQTKYAMIVWCVGDIGWIVYDMSILPRGENDPRNLPRAGESLLSFFFNVGVAV